MRRTIFTLIMLCMIALNIQAQNTWTLAGSKALFGSEWDITDNSNDMISKDNGIFELVKKDCILEQNVNYEFKVVANHDWAEAYPFSNYGFKVQETGTYTVTILFDENTKDITVNTEKTGGAVVAEKTWTVAGFSALLGSEWDPEDTRNDMIKQENGTYTLTKTKVQLTAGTYDYKVCANHGWSESYGDNSINASITIEEDGTYNITFTFNPATHEVSATATTAGTTGIHQDAIVNNNQKVIIYTLQGLQITSPKHGVNIINGKKIFVK